MNENHITLSPSQRQRLLITCKHIDQLLKDIEETLNATASKGVFENYINDITDVERRTIEDYIGRLRGKLRQVLVSQSLAPESPHISAAHSIEVGLTFIEVSIEELAPRYMRGYGPVSQDGASDLHSIIATLQPVAKEFQSYVQRLSQRAS